MKKDLYQSPSLSWQEVESAALLDLSPINQYSDDPQLSNDGLFDDEDNLPAADLPSSDESSAYSDNLRHLNVWER